MGKVAYGIPVPRGVQKDWEVTSMTTDSGGPFFRRYGVVSDWGEPIRCVAWFDRFGRCRLCVGEYANGRTATVRIDMNANWKTSFGDASVDERSQSHDPEEGHGAKPPSAVTAQPADAQTPQPLNLSGEA